MALRPEQFTADELAACGYRWFDGEGRLWTGAQVADLLREPGARGPFYRIGHWLTEDRFSGIREAKA